MQSLLGLAGRGGPELSVCFAPVQSGCFNRCPSLEEGVGRQRVRWGRGGAGRKEGCPMEGIEAGGELDAPDAFGP